MCQEASGLEEHTFVEAGLRAAACGTVGGAGQSPGVLAECLGVVADVVMLAELLLYEGPEPVEDLVAMLILRHRRGEPDEQGR